MNGCLFRYTSYRYTSRRVLKQVLEGVVLQIAPNNERIKEHDPRLLRVGGADQLAFHPEPAGLHWCLLTDMTHATHAHWTDTAT